MRLRHSAAKALERNLTSTCSQREFARLIGKSPAFVNQLAAMGIVDARLCGVLLEESLERYLREYPYAEVDEVIAAVMTGGVVKISNLHHAKGSCARRVDLDSCRRINERLVEVESRIVLCRLLQSIIVAFENSVDEYRRLKKKLAALNRSRRNLRESLETAQNSFLQRLNQAGVAGNERAVLVCRYVDCLRFFEIEYRLDMSKSTVYRLHRRGVQKILAMRRRATQPAPI